MNSLKESSLDLEHIKPIPAALIHSANKKKLDNIIEDCKQRILIELSRIKRTYSEKFVSYLNSTSFFIDPASAYYHNAFRGGLLFHCCNIIYIARKQNLALGLNVPDESIVISSIAHDLVKVDRYTIDSRRKQNIAYKNDRDHNFGWYDAPSYTVKKEKADYGHGQTALYLIMKHVSPDFLTPDEEMAIVYHMGSWDEFIKNQFGNLIKGNPLLLLLHTADTWSGALYETEGAIEHLIY